MTQTTTRKANPGKAGFLLLMLTMATALFAMGAAHSHDKGPGGKRGGGIEARVEHMMDKVGASDEQRTQIRAVMDGQRDKFREVHDRMRSARKALHELDPLQSGYDGEVQRLAGEIGQASSDMTVLMADGRKQIWQVLNEEQRAKAAKLKDERREKFRERRMEREPAED